MGLFFGIVVIVLSTGWGAMIFLGNMMGQSDNPTAKGVSYISAFIGYAVGALLIASHYGVVPW